MEEEILDSEAVVVPEEERTDLPEVEEQIPDLVEEGNDSWWLNNDGQDGNSEGNDALGVRCPWVDQLGDPRIDTLVCLTRESNVP